MSETLPIASQVFLRREGEILLAMKKRGFGVGYWNGAGGKPEPGETMIETAIRECEEEICVRPLKLSLVGLFNFHFSPASKHAGKDQQVHTYFCTEWDGEPAETEEMRPEWFHEEHVPYDEMWSYNIISLPRLLAGETMRAEFRFDAHDLVIAQTIKPLGA